jgi:GDPmannose 4,6-dehydratase
MWMMQQQPSPDDYVLATGEAHSVREFVELAFRQVGRSLMWRREGVEEEGIDQATGQILVSIDPRYFRPSDVDLLLGDPAKARRTLGWHHRTGFRELVAEMMDADLEAARCESSHQRAQAYF